MWAVTTYIDPFYVSLFPYRHDGFTSSKAAAGMWFAVPGGRMSRLEGVPLSEDRGGTH